MDWYDKAEQEIELEFEEGEMTIREYNRAMNELHEEYQQSRCDAAQDTYDNY